jgi:hypothetical protein
MQWERFANAHTSISRRKILQYNAFSLMSLTIDHQVEQPIYVQSFLRLWEEKLLREISQKARSHL